MQNHNKMCVSSHKICFSMQKKESNRCRIRVCRLTRRRMRCQENVGNDMVLKNLKLYIENMSILEENRRLRKKASLLHQENLELMSQIQKNSSPAPDRASSTSP